MKGQCAIASPGSASFGLLLARLAGGVTLAFCGYRHVAHDGISNFVSNNISSVPGYMPGWFGNLYLHAIPFAEIALGALLVLGLMSRLSGLLAGLMLISFGIAKGGMYGFVNPDPAVPSQLLQAPAVFAAFALIVFFAGPGKASVDNALFSGKPKGDNKKPAH